MSSVNDKINLKEKAYRFFLRPFGSLFHRANSITSRFYQDLDPVYKIKTKYGNIAIYCLNTTLLWRARSFFSKEPDTIEWIDSFQKGEVLFDVGANIGLYSLYAALKGCSVFSFEPEASNFALLNRHIFLNNLSSKVSAFGIALGDKVSFDYLNISKMLPGWACHNVGEAKDFEDKVYTPEFIQGVVTYTLDSLLDVPSLPVPNHLKIDVDGLEDKIILGASRLLTKPELRSILIELNVSLDRDRDIAQTIEKAGFTCESKYHSSMFDGTKFDSVKNYIFRRK